MDNKITKTVKTSNNSLDELKKKLDILAKGLGGLELPRSFYQLVVFVLDASGSMTQNGITGKTKGEEIHDQIIPIIERLNSSRNAAGFDISMYAFSNGYSEFLPLSSLKSIDITRNFNPCKHLKNEKTFAASALQDVEIKVSHYLEQHKEKNCQAMVLILSDGAFHDYEKTHEICTNMKQNSRVTIASYILEDVNWKNTMSEKVLTKLKENVKSLSSTDSNGINFFMSKVDPEDIRKHMIKSISTVSKLE